MASLIIAILVAGAMPYMLTGVAKAGAFSGRDNARTRDWQAALTGWRQRAHWAHQNAFEAFPLFAATVLCVLLTDPTARVAPWLAWGFIGLRVAYSAFYVGNFPRLRSLTWFGAVLCVVALFYVAVSAAGRLHG